MPIHRLQPTGIALAVLLGLASSASASNMVVNGSFENGFNGWTLGGSAQGGAPAVPIFYNSSGSYPTGAYGESVPQNNALTNSPDAVGTRAAYFVDDRALNETLSQTVFLAAGDYQIGFSAYLPQNGFNNAGDATFTGSIAGLTLANFTASTLTARTWRTYVGSTTITTSGNYQIAFTFNTNQAPSKDVVIDQVYIISVPPPLSLTAAVPEPSTITLLGTGAGALVIAGLRRRHRSR